jgi:hypothetical protein
MATAQDTELDAFITARFGLSALTKLNNQVRGGDSNEKGTTLEEHFAIYKLAKFYNESANDDVEISSQVRAYVDDLVIENKTSNTKRSYQLKDSLKVSWNSKVGIAPYFHQQYEIDTNLLGLVQSKTLLVNAIEDVHKKRLNDIPENIQGHTICMYFPNETLSWLLSNNPSFRQEMGRLCSFPDDDDKLLSVSEILIGVWCGRNRRSEDDKKVNNLINRARNNADPDFFLPTADEQVELDTGIKEILDSFEEISYRITGGFLVYGYRGLSGQVKSKIGTAPFNNIFDVIINESPNTVAKLLTLLMGTGDGI